MRREKAVGLVGRRSGCSPTVVSLALRERLWWHTPLRTWRCIICSPRCSSCSLQYICSLVCFLSETLPLGSHRATLLCEKLSDLMKVKKPCPHFLVALPRHLSPWQASSLHQPDTLLTMAQSFSHKLLFQTLWTSVGLLHHTNNFLYHLRANFYFSFPINPICYCFHPKLMRQVRTGKCQIIWGYHFFQGHIKWGT